MPHQGCDTEQYWFPAKRYGWGWGLPSRWQGWATLAVYALLMITGAYLFPPDKNVSAFMAVTIVLSLLLVGVCWLKGEPPRWRWGED